MRVFGWFCFTLGIIIIFGALAYRSAKKRKLGEIRASSLRKALEVCAIVIIIAAVLLQKNLPNNIIDDPIPNLIIPLWAIIAYMVIALKNQKNKTTIPSKHHTRYVGNIPL